MANKERVASRAVGHHRTMRLGSSIGRLYIYGFVASLVASVSTCSSAAVAEPSDITKGATLNSANSSKLNLREYKKSATVDVNASQSRLFRISHRIIRTSVANPEIAEPVVLAENAFFVLGKRPGETTIHIWDDEGCESGMNVIVTDNSGELNTLFSNVTGAVFERFHGTLNSSAKEIFTPARLRVTESTDPRIITTSMNQEQAAVALTTAQTIEYIDTNPTTTGKMILPRSASTNDAIKTRKDILTVSGGKDIAISSGFKTAVPTKVVGLIESQARVFKTDSVITKVNTSDPFIAEPVVISANEIVLLGKHRGKTHIEIIDDAGLSEAFELIVQRQHRPFLSAVRAFNVAFAGRLGFRRANAHYAPVDVRPVDFYEQKTTDIVVLEKLKPKFFKTASSLLMASTANPCIAELAPISTTQFALVGKMPGRTTLFLWDDAHSTAKLDIIVTGPPTLFSKRIEPFDTNVSRNPASKGERSQVSAESDSTPPILPLSAKIEIWNGTRKDIVSVLGGWEHNNIGSDQPDVTAEFLKRLNNAAVLSLNAKEYEKAFKGLETALHYAPNYKTARDNLSVAYNNYGLHFQNDPKKAIPYFHHALYLYPEDKVCQGNLKGMIQKLGKDPASFQDRVFLGDEARDSQDTTGSIIEYRAALTIRDDASVRTKLDEAIRVNEDKEKQDGQRI